MAVELAGIDSRESELLGVIRYKVGKALQDLPITGGEVNYSMETLLDENRRVRRVLLDALEAVCMLT